MAKEEIEPTKIDSSVNLFAYISVVSDLVLFARSAEITRIAGTVTTNQLSTVMIPSILLTGWDESGLARY